MQINSLGSYMFAQLLQSFNIILTNSVGPEQNAGVHSSWSPSTLAENALRDIFFTNWLKFIFKIGGWVIAKKIFIFPYAHIEYYVYLCQ